MDDRSVHETERRVKTFLHDRYDQLTLEELRVLRAYAKKRLAINRAKGQNRMAAEREWQIAVIDGIRAERIGNGRRSRKGPR